MFPTVFISIFYRAVEYEYPVLVLVVSIDIVGTKIRSLYFLSYLWTEFKSILYISFEEQPAYKIHTSLHMIQYWYM